MDTTYRLDGFAAIVTSDTISYDFGATFETQAPANTASFSYTTTGAGLDTLFNLSGDLTSGTVDGGISDNEFVVFTPFNVSVTRVNWSGGTTDVLTVLTTTGITQQLAIFELNGASLASIDTEFEANSFFVEYGTQFGPIVAGPAQPNQTIQLSGMSGFEMDPIAQQPGISLTGTNGDDNLIGTENNDTLDGGAGNDVIQGLDGVDQLIGGIGNDTITGGTSVNDLRDNIFGGGGNDLIDGGYGNDELRGDAGNDTIAGGFGVDTVIGGTGDDVMTGSAFSDLIFGGDDNDFVNGGFGSDRVNGGNGADRFFHLGIADHGNDWIQDFDNTEGDILLYGGAATIDDFQVNIATTASAGSAGVDEAFVIFRPTGQILWALVDGDGQSEITIRIEGTDYDLLA